MARRKFEFRPDKTQTSFFSRFFLTKKQRANLLKWSLYSLLLLAASLVQDVLLSSLRILGTTTELVPVVIFLVCLLEGAQSGSLFCLGGGCFYLFSGSAPGYYALPVITILALVVTMFRQGYLRRGFGTTFFCLAVGFLVYEMLIFAIAYISGSVPFDRYIAFWLKGLLSLAAVPVLYPVAASIEKIGGEIWKE